MASILAQPGVSGCVKARPAARRSAGASEPAAIFFPASEAAVHAPDLSGNFFVRPESDRRCETRKIAAEYKSAPGFFHQLEEIIAEIVRAAVAPGTDIFLRTEILERLAIGDQSARRDISLDLEVAQKLLGERIPGVRRRHSSYSGFSMVVRLVAARARSLNWLLKIGAGRIETSSYFFRTNSG